MIKIFCKFPIIKLLKISTIIMSVAFMFVSGLIEASPIVIQQEEEKISRDKLIEDTRQMAKLLETVHPQPYFKGGGKMAFHRRLQNILHNIPKDGMTRETYRGLLSPLVASVDDGHTYVYADGSFDWAGVPLLFYIVEKELYVSAVFVEGHKQYLGARLRRLEGIELPDLLKRTHQYYGADNEYGTLTQLGNYELFLAKKSVIEDIIPEWTDKSKIKISLLLPNGNPIDVVLPTFKEYPNKVFRPNPGIELPPLNGREFNWGFLDEKGNTAYLRVLTTSKNMETFEKQMTYSDPSEDIRDLYENLYDKAPEGTIEEILAKLPSLTATYGDMVRQMKEKKSKALVIDLRTNVGGFALSADVLIYFLYGKEALIDLHRSVNIATRKLSTPYFNDDPDLTLDEINALGEKYKLRNFDLVTDDYDFSDPQMLEDGLLEREYARKLVEDDLKLSKTFWAEYQAGTHSNFYKPDNVIVVTDSATFSSGFTFAKYFDVMGATIVGSVPSENIGQMGESFRFRLKNTNLGGSISRSYLVHDSTISEDEVSKTLLIPDHELTYEKLKELGFSRPSAIEYALELLRDGDLGKNH
jgi:hypothetical protein